MKKVPKILVPIDFSPCAENALAYALQFANKIKGIVQVLNVPTFDVPPPDYPSFVAVTTEDKIKFARQAMNQSLAKVREETSKLIDEQPEVQTNIEIGIPDSKICDIATRDTIDYIIMGTQGENSVWDKFLGSVASNVLKNAPCPVFVIPEKARFKSDLVLGYASNFSDADPFEIWKATKILQDMQPEIKCVHLNKTNQDGDAKIKTLEEFFSENAPDLKISFYSIAANDLVEDLNNFVDEEGINLLVMYQHKKTFFQSLFRKDLIKQVALHVEVPLLVLNEN